MTVAAVVLAAGAGSRFAGPHDKLTVPFRGRPLVAWALDAAHGAGCADTLLVVAPDSGAARLASDLDGVTVLVNEAPERGLASSLAVAVDRADQAGHDALVVGLGDQPFLTTEAWRTLAAADSVIAIATYDGRRGHPVRIARPVWPDLPTTGDAGARELLDLRPDLVRELPCQGNPVDIDTLEDLERWS